MNFDELTINRNNKDDNHSASTTTAANAEIETRFSETPRHATTSSVNHSCSVNQPVSNQDLQTIIGPYPFEALSGFHWVPTWQLFPLHQKAVVQPSTSDVFTSDTPSIKVF